MAFMELLAPTSQKWLGPFRRELIVPLFHTPEKRGYLYGKLELALGRHYGSELLYCFSREAQDLWLLLFPKQDY